MSSPIFIFYPKQPIDYPMTWWVSYLFHVSAMWRQQPSSSIAVVPSSVIIHSPLFFASFLPSPGRPVKGSGGPLLAKFLHTLLFQNTHTKATPAKGEETGMGWVMSALGILHVLQSDLKHPIIHLTKVEKLCYTLTFEFERRNHQNLLNSVQEGEVSKIWS